MPDGRLGGELYDLDRLRFALSPFERFDVDSCVLRIEALPPSLRSPGSPGLNAAR